MPGPSAGACPANRLADGYDAKMRATLLLLLVGFAVAVLIFAATGGHVIFLPLLIVLPLGLLGLRRRR